MKDTIRQITNLVTALIALAVNIMATTLPLNGQDTGAISDRFQVYFVPAGYVFSIWGVIYIGWGSHIVWIDPDNDLVTVLRWIDRKQAPQFVERLLGALG